MMVFLLLSRVALHKAFLQSTFMRRLQCSMAIMECWWRDKYEITSAKFLFLYQYLSPWLPRTKNRFLDLCGLMSESRLTARQHIKGIDIGLPLAFFLNI